MYRTLNPGRTLRASCAALAAAVCASAPAQAQAPARPALTYPPSLEHAALVAWMKRDTDLPPETVVAISPLAVIAITQTKPVVSPEGFEVTVRAETVDEGFSRSEGLASWRATVKLACKDRTFSMGEVTGYPDRNMQGEGRAIQTAMVNWTPVTPGTIQGEIWKARCDKDFKGGPLANADEKAPPPPTASTAPVVAPKATMPSLPAAEPRRSTPERETSVQILSAPTAAEAVHALADLKAKFGDAMAGLGAEVVTVQVGGKTLHRAIVSGFKAPGEATRFCGKLQAAGRKCFARQDGGRAASESVPSAAPARNR